MLVWLFIITFVLDLDEWVCTGLWQSLLIVEYGEVCSSNNAIFFFKYLKF